MMKKHLLKLVIVVLFISVIWLSGCDEIGNPLSGDESKFIGTWHSESDLDIYTMIFFSDGTGSFIGLSTLWELKDGKLVIITAGEEMTLTYDYSFSDDDNTLTVIDVSSGRSRVYIKQLSI
jgi:hypothetical protein